LLKRKAVTFNAACLNGFRHNSILKLVFCANILPPKNIQTIDQADLTQRQLADLIGDDLTATDIGHIKTAVLNRMGNPGTPTIVSNIVVQGNSGLALWQSGHAGMLVAILNEGGRNYWEVTPAGGGWPSASDLEAVANFDPAVAQILLRNPHFAGRVFAE